MTLQTWLIIVASFVVLALALAVIAHSVEKIKGTLFSGVLTKLWKVVPWAFEKFPVLARYWAAKQVQAEIRNQLGASIDGSFDVSVSVDFAEGSETKALREGKRLLVIYHPGKDPAENFCKVAVEYARSCLPHADKILDDELRECVTLKLAKTIVEGHSGDYAQHFSAEYLLEDGNNRNRLSDNPFHDRLSAMDEKRVLFRVFLNSLRRLAENFDSLAKPEDLRHTTRKLADALATVSEKLLLSTDLPPLADTSAPDQEKGFEYFFNENGLRVNLMLVRSETHFHAGDTAPYVRKARALVERDVDIHFVMAAPAIPKLNPAEYNNRVGFARAVTQAIMKDVGSLRFCGESEKDFVHLKQAYPVYISTFLRRGVRGR